MARRNSAPLTKDERERLEVGAKLWLRIRTPEEAAAALRRAERSAEKTHNPKAEALRDVLRELAPKHEEISSADFPEMTLTRPDNMPIIDVAMAAFNDAFNSL